MKYAIVPKMFIYNSFFLIRIFFILKLLFSQLFLKQSTSVASFFFFFSAATVGSVFFYKYITFKKHHVYNLNQQPVFFLKSRIIANKVSSFLQDNDFSYSNKSNLQRRRERTFSIRKTFKIWKKVSLNKFFLFYRFKFLKRRNLNSFFSNFKKKKFTEMASFFSLNFLSILHRIFPFFNFFLLRKLVIRGLILINFRKITSFFFKLRVGDFVSIFFLNDCWSLMFSQLQVQNRHYFKVKKKLSAFSASYAVKDEKTMSNHYSKHFRTLTIFSKKIPTWLEVDFLTFSFFVIRAKHLGSFFFFFNPFLYRLLAFR